MDDILNLPDDLDSFAVAQRIESTGPPLEVARRYADLINELYWKRKDLPRAIVMGTLGIHYAMLRADDDAAGSELRGVAKQMAFNLGSFAWPGWAEAGITITPAALAAGRDAARLNLRLAIELNRPPDRVANAHWLVGAYALADGRTDEAVAAFERAAALDDSVTELAAAAMNRGYVALARLALEPNSLAREQVFVTALKAIEAVESEDSLFYLDQLKTARGVFART